MLRRRDVLAAGLLLPLAPRLVLASDDAERLLREGGVVIAFRHAPAPGTFDPPNFTLGDCRTQRNLNDEGRAQARRIGQWFQARGLLPARDGQHLFITAEGSGQLLRWNLASGAVSLLRGSLSRPTGIERGASRAMLSGLADTRGR